MSVRPVVALTVEGTPVPQGSKRAFLSPKTKRVVMTESGGTRHTSWRAEVTTHARQAMWDAGLQPLTGPVSVTLTFYFRRPLGHYGTGRNAQTLREGAAPFPIRPPDLDKLTRSIWDSLTSVVWVDDAQVVATTLRKRWVDRFDGTPEGVAIEVGVIE